MTESQYNNLFCVIIFVWFAMVLVCRKRYSLLKTGLITLVALVHSFFGIYISMFFMDIVYSFFSLTNINLSKLPSIYINIIFCLVVFIFTSFLIFFIFIFYIKKMELEPVGKPLLFSISLLPLIIAMYLFIMWTFS